MHAFMCNADVFVNSYGKSLQLYFWIKPCEPHPRKNNTDNVRATPEGTFYYAYYITLFGGHNRTPRPSTTTTTYPHIISLFPACKKKIFLGTLRAAPL